MQQVCDSITHVPMQITSVNYFDDSVRKESRQHRVRSVWSSVHVGEPVNMECDDVASMHLCICLVECESCTWNCLPFTAFVIRNLAKYQ